MEATEQGRYCNSCEKQVIDFTGFTDQQILQYFLKNPFPVCGKMRASQLERRYQHSTPSVNRRFSPVAASLLSLAAITSQAAPAAPLKPKTHLVQQFQNKQPTINLTDSLIISGTVKNVKGIPLENVEIIFMESKILSDVDGNFQFTLPAPLNKPFVIQFSYPGLDKEVRSYHPAMGSTSYKVTLNEPYFPERYIMGGIGSYIHVPDSLSFLPFHRTSNKFNKECKAFLADLAKFIKDNPNQIFTIIPIYKMNKRKAVNTSNLIKDFLVNEEGIDQERISLGDPQLNKDITSELIIHFEPKASE